MKIAVKHAFQSTTGGYSTFLLMYIMHLITFSALNWKVWFKKKKKKIATAADLQGQNTLLVKRYCLIFKYKISEDK